MKIFEIACPSCDGFILGPREGGKACGRWLGYDECLKCRQAKKPAEQAAS